MKKIVLITGASGEIGGAIARAFANAGYSLALHYNNGKENAEKLFELLTQNGCDAFLIQGDLSDKGAAKKIIDECIAHFGKIDVLVNNAGVSLIKQIQDVSYAEYEKIMSVNMGGAFLCSREAVKGMLDNKSGLIVNISSVWGEVGGSCESVYSASKSALLGFTKALAKELGWSGIRVNSVSPGVIDTPMNAHFSAEDMQSLKEEIPMGRIGTGEDVAKAVLYLEENDYVTGIDLPVNGGFSIV